MWILPLSTPQKIGIILYGLVIGVGTTLMASAGLLLLGLALSLLSQYTGWPPLGEYRPWLPIAGLEYGFLLGIPLGAFVWWRVSKSRLTDPKATDSTDEPKHIGQ